MSDPRRPEAPGGDTTPPTEPTWLPVARMAALRFDPGATVEVGEREFAVFPADDGDAPIVVQNSCPHAGGPLAEGRLEAGQVRCPWHGWTFELATGACTHRADQAVRRVPARVRDGVLELRLPPC